MQEKFSFAAPRNGLPASVQKRLAVGADPKNRYPIFVLFFLTPVNSNRKIGGAYIKIDNWERRRGGIFIAISKGNVIILN